MLFSAISDYFSRGNPFNRLRLTRRRKENPKEPSFSELLPWLDVDKQGRVLLDDGKSVAMAIELFPRNMEEKPESVIDELHHGLESLMAQSFHETDENPWIMQVYSFHDQGALLEDWQKSVASCEPQAGNYKGTNSMRSVFEEHMKKASTARHMFFDDLSNGHPWRGGRQRVICCIYRYHHGAKLRQPMKELESQLGRMRQQLKACNIKYRVLDDGELSTWLARWFEPDAEERTSEQLAQQRSSFDYTLSDAVSPRTARSNGETGVWRFGNRFSRLCSVERFRMPPKAGEVSNGSMRESADYSLIEELPRNAVAVMTTVFTSIHWVEEHLDHIEDSAVGNSTSARASKEAADKARYDIMTGSKLYPFSMAIYLNGHSEAEVEELYDEVDALLMAHQIQLLPYADDPVALDTYLRHLPMAYRYSLDQIRYRNQLMYSRDIVSMLPLYGRAKGSGRLGLTFFNRGGELLTVNPLDLSDRRKNAHLFLFGPTGAGKSATLCYLQMLLMTYHRPRIIVIEAGNSYGLLASYFESKGLKVRDMALKPGCGVNLSPFQNLLKARKNTLEQERQDPDFPTANRDWLGEMAVLVRLMITGGKQKEIMRTTRADEAAQMRAIKIAARKNPDSMTVSDICAAFDEISKNVDNRQRKARLYEMRDALSLFTMGFAGELFNGEGKAWEDADYVRLDLGILAGAENHDMLAVAWLGLVSNIISFAEETQHDGRQTILLTDEAHVITGNPLLADYAVKISKLLGRRLGLWLWMATQNISDFSGESQKMLEMFEWWLTLGLSGSEVDALSNYKQLERNTYAVLSRTRKLSGRYTEGVIIGDQFSERFRNVPPPLCLALAQTEKEEKSYRRKLMHRYSCTELEAAVRISKEIARANK